VVIKIKFKLKKSHITIKTKQ